MKETNQEKKMHSPPILYYFRGWNMVLGRSSQGPEGVPRNREKLPISTPKNESNLTRYWDFCEKMWHLSKSKDVILLYELTNIPKVAAPKGELQSPDEEKTTFSQKYPDFSSNSTRFLGSKVAIFSCGKVL